MYGLKPESIHNKFLGVVFSLIFSFIALLFPITLLAQETLSGGSYSLNGGVTVFTGQGSGGVYVLNPSGDPITGEGSGGAYTIYPTPFSSSSNTTSSSDDESSSSGGSSGAGFTSTSTLSENNFIPPSTEVDSPTSPIVPEDEYKPSKPILTPGIVPGVEWIDTGSGIDTDLDGENDFWRDIFLPRVSDSPYASSTYNQNNINTPVQNTLDSKGKAYERLSQFGITLKEYALTLSTLELAVLLLFVLLCGLVPVVRGKNPRLVSFAPIKLFIEYVISLHRGMKLSIVPVQNLRRNIDGNSENYYFHIHIIDAFILPICLVLGAVYIFSMSWAISILILSPILVRWYIGKRLLTRSSSSV